MLVLAFWSIVVEERWQEGGGRDKSAAGDQQRKVDPESSYSPGRSCRGARGAGPPVPRET